MDGMREQEHHGRRRRRGRSENRRQHRAMQCGGGERQELSEQHVRDSRHEQATPAFADRSRYQDHLDHQSRQENNVGHHLRFDDDANLRRPVSPDCEGVDRVMHHHAESRARRAEAGSRSSRGHGRAPRSKKVSVPDNWSDVPKIGTPVASSRCIAMRVPLDDKYTRLIHSEDELWTPEGLLQVRITHGYDVRLLIDLTNTTKYYDGDAAFRGSNVQYVKLPIEGFKSPPRRSDVDAFIRIVDSFTASDATGLVAVHCTHGLNRTGYLVVSYLVQRCGMTVQDALKAFSDARPPGLIKHMYVQDLFRLFAPEAAVELPELPEWAAAKYAARRPHSGR